jgi:malate/lactate dehydrogenase
MERVVEIQFDAEERKLFDESVSHVKDLVGLVRKAFPDLG